MKTSFLIILVFISQWTFSQSQNWSKDDRNSIFNEFMNLLSEYNNISNDQKESISLCCLEEITKKYNKDDFKSKIDIEIKRIQQATITQCATNIGVDLSNIKVEKKQEQKSTTELKLSGFKKEDFEGVWNFEFGTYTFYSVDGEFKYKHPSYQNVARGKWYLDGKILILDDTKTLLKWGSAKYQIVSVSKNEIVLVNIASGAICNLKRVQ